MFKKTRSKVPCDCKECNGKLVDERTRNRHHLIENDLASNISGFIPSNSFFQSNLSSFPNALTNATPEIDNPILEGSLTAMEIDDPVMERSLRESSSETGSDEQEESSDYDSDFEYYYASQKRRRKDHFRGPEAHQFDNDDPVEFEYHNDTNIKCADSWILIWIFKYQSRFHLSDVSIDVLIKFFHQVLEDANKTRSESFPTSLYAAKKLLKFNKCSKNFVACTNCHTLYNAAEIATEFKCKHVEFPNHTLRNKREPCGTELTKQISINKGYKRRPKMLFPLPSLKMQITTLYQRPEFEKQLKKWTNRHVNGLITDIYDGEIWKTFPDDQSSPFFTPETADSHLGIMLNLDWFQPFDSTVYSVGVIYGAICNLPRDIRFKKENMLTLGLLPGPEEVKLHKINNYLAPIINELLEFWNGVNLPSTNDFPTGRNIRIAVICCSSDVPATRKLGGHISALVGCHRCYKKADKGEGQRLNFGGFEDMDDWFTMRNAEEHRRNALIWKKQQSEDDRNKHVRRTHVRWSEMLRLPYHNPIRHLVVDPMHNLFLGIAKWIVKKLWIDGGKIVQSDLEAMEKQANEIKIPADMGRIPNKIATGNGFSGFTADQWKTFILIYAIPLLWNLLNESDQKILGNFVRACSLLVCRIIDNDMLNEAHERLLKVAILIEENYGPQMISPNIHLSLHIADCCKDYGPLYSFWCYSFERMNGILGIAFKL
jgi:hypothetical protein